MLLEKSEKKESPLTYRRRRLITIDWYSYFTIVL